MRLSDKDLEIVDLKGRINSLEILGKRYQAALRKIKAGHVDGNRLSYEHLQGIARDALSYKSDGDSHG